MKYALAFLLTLVTTLVGACTSVPTSNHSSQPISLPESTSWSLVGTEAVNQFRNAIALDLHRLDLAAITNNCHESLTEWQAGYDTERVGYQGHPSNYIIISYLKDIRYPQFLGAHKSISLSPTMDTLAVSSEIGTLWFYRAN